MQLKKGGTKMSGISHRFTPVFLLAGSLAFSAAVLASPRSSAQDSQQTQPDNTKKNRDQSSPTADQQKMNPSDRATTQKIRRAVMADKSLSTYAHNVKIVAQDGKVTLRGPVRSDDEKRSVEAKAAAVVGEGNVTSQIEITPSK
jgi:hyperosmotically inducible periplasmic protein